MSENPFLRAWKNAIIASGHYGAFYSPANPDWTAYKSQSDIEAATDKNQLRPNIEVLEKLMPKLSPSDVSFMLSMLSFFNNTHAQNMATECRVLKFPFVGVLAHQLDSGRKQALIDLMLSYRGW